PGEVTEADCKKAVGTGDWLDQFQTKGDGKVVFCHSGSGTNYSVINTSTSACLSHADHTYDVYPTTICDS
ncbi:MAG: hypothetical protein P8R54_23165, partial [Myxococcota bacterium]|nr:hypothetical protein [Myxococcota bacterium]